MRLSRNNTTLLPSVSKQARKHNHPAVHQAHQQHRTLLWRLSGLAVLTMVVAKVAFLSDPAQQLKLVHWIDGTIRDIWIRAEQSGAVPLFPAYSTTYHDDFPHFRLLEDNYETIRQEAIDLLQVGNIPRLKDLVNAKRSESLVYKVDWKVYWLKMGLWIPENAAKAPKTTQLIGQIPNMYNAFFSVLEPDMHIDPHWGHYKGFLRYHLGLVVPQNNTNRDIFLRIRPDIEKDRYLLMPDREDLLADTSNGAAKYFWHEGEGVMFDDNPLHDATNCSNETRIVLFLDVARKMPWRYDVFNRVSLFFANRMDPIAAMRAKATVHPEKELSKVQPEDVQEFKEKNIDVCASR